MWLSVHPSICLYAKPNTLENKIVVPYCNHSYYVASSASGQDDPNCALWLVTQAGKMEPSCPLGTTRCIPQAKFPRKAYNKSFIDQVCSVKMTGYWPGSFFARLWTLTSSRSINTQKKELGQYPTILTSHLVSNPYMILDIHDMHPCYG